MSRLLRGFKYKVLGLQQILVVVRCIAVFLSVLGMKTGETKDTYMGIRQIFKFRVQPSFKIKQTKQNYNFLKMGLLEFCIKDQMEAQ